MPLPPLLQEAAPAGRRLGRPLLAATRKCTFLACWLNDAAQRGAAQELLGELAATCEQEAARHSAAGQPGRGRKAAPVPGLLPGLDRPCMH